MLLAVVAQDSELHTQLEGILGETSATAIRGFDYDRDDGATVGREMVLRFSADDFGSPEERMKAQFELALQERAHMCSTATITTTTATSRNTLQIERSISGICVRWTSGTGADWR